MGEGPVPPVLKPGGMMATSPLIGGATREVEQVAFQAQPALIAGRRHGRCGYDRHRSGQDSIEYVRHSTAYYRPKPLIVAVFNSLLVYAIESQGQHHEWSPEIYSGAD